MIALLAVLAQGSTVSLSVPPTPLYRLEMRLGEVFGEAVDVAPELENEVIVIHVKGVEPGALKGRLAEAVCGEWVERDGRLVLRPDREEEERREAQVVGDLAEDLEAYFEDELKKGVVQTPEQRRAILTGERWFYAKAPGERRTLEAVASIPGEELARALLFESATYSSNPSSLERPFPTKGMEAVRGLGEDWRGIAKELRPLGFTTSPEVVGFWGADKYQLPEVGEGTDLVYYVEALGAPLRHGAPVGYCGFVDETFESVWLNGVGRRIDQVANPDQDGLEFHQDARQKAGFRSRNEVILRDQRKVWAAREERELREVLREGRKGLRANPREPFADLYGDAFARFAEAEGVQLCALISDAWLAISSTEHPAVPQEEEEGEPMWFEWVGHQFDADTRDFLDWRKEDGWLTCRALVPQWEREGRLDQRMYGRALAMIEKGTWPSFATVISDPAWRKFLLGQRRAMHLALPGLGFQVEESAGENFWRLEASTLAGFLDGRSRRFSSLTKGEQRMILESVNVKFGGGFYWDNDQSRSGGPEASLVPSRRFAEADLQDAVLEFGHSWEDQTLSLRDSEVRPEWSEWEPGEGDVAMGQVRVHELSLRIVLNEREWIRGTGWYREYFRGAN